MAFFHLRNVPGYRWPALPDAVFAPVWNAYLELDRTQWLPPEELVAGQLEQVRTLLVHCIKHVPYYRDVLSAARVVPDAIRTLDDFRRVPLLPRRIYQEKSDKFLAQELPKGTIATATSQTAGSTGTPVTTYLTNGVGLWWHAFFLRDLEWCNIDPTGVVASIRASMHTGAEREMLMQGISQSCWAPELDPLLQTGPSYTMDIHQDLHLQMQWLRRINPDYLVSYPSNLKMLARLLHPEGRLPALRAIQVSSESLTPEVRATIESSFGVPVKNLYSCNEAGYLASTCPEGHGLHVHAENVLLEVLDEHGSPCRAGDSGHVYITHLHNLRGPYIRYQLGDEATLEGESCLCGRGLPLLRNIRPRKGRS